ncbi:MAG: TIGR04076 family protein [Anaerolineae bacterium]
MSHRMPQCRITVLKRTIHQDLIDEYAEPAYRDMGRCECFEEGDTFIVDPATPPEELLARCPWAWADIRQAILTVAYGGDPPGMNRPGTVITGCTDWFRPVIFKVERLRDE